MSRSVMMSDLSWPEYKRRLEEEDAIILLPVGAVEQHGYHLPLGTDWIMATEMSRRAAERVGGIVAPPVMYAYKSQIRSGGGNHFCGTTSLDGREPDRDGARRAQGVRPARGAQDRGHRRPLRERVLPHRGLRPGGPGPALRRHHRCQDSQDALLRGDLRRGARHRLSRRLPGARAGARGGAGDVDDAPPVPAPGRRERRSRTTRQPTSLPTTSIRATPTGCRRRAAWPPAHGSSAEIGKMLVEEFTGLVSGALEAQFRTAETVAERKAS